MSLDLEGIAVSTGAACSSGVTKTSTTLRALGYDEAAARCLVRFSLGAATTAQDIARVLAVWPAVVARVRAAAPALLAVSSPSDAAATPGARGVA
jgi:cysteine desulfurase